MLPGNALKFIRALTQRIAWIFYGWISREVYHLLKYLVDLIMNHRNLSEKEIVIIFYREYKNDDNDDTAKYTYIITTGWDIKPR